ncbi:hypothetical protein EDF56_104144 [Novosphingobium sp. PhB165]|uniref:putative hemolysin n=1 Tax=Novosphingobium sp. PhB165 TaxID=2485105 RepID=UPI00104BFF14|nr:DUF333 domain-containing protein [Novosphingobium sp. PhB165]TCM18614.1 hypothetical protein EDF56_104144 [Novosphingobium sp. PhB165]
MTVRSVVAPALPALALVLAGCASDGQPAPAPIGMANPASKYCVEQGGRSEIRQEAQGETGYCHLPDGRVVEEWQLFREAHPANDH